MFNQIRQNYNIGVEILIIIGLVILAAALSFVLFTFGYWLIVLILEGFFNFILPFSWWYSFGAWLIALVLSMFILPGKLIQINRD